MNNQTYNNQNLISPQAEKEIEAFFSEFENDNEEIDEEQNLLKSVEKVKESRRNRRKNARKAKAHQIKLSSSLGRQTKKKKKSIYRHSPVWHKMKLLDISPKKFKARFDDAFAKNTIEEFESSTSNN